MRLREYGENTPAETRHEAHESVNKEIRYKQILELLENEPMTAKEMAVELFWKGKIPSAERNFVSPRVTELMHEGIVEPIGKKKCQFTGKKVTVYALMSDKWKYLI